MFIKTNHPPHTHAQNVYGNRIILTNNYLNCKWVKCSNPKTKTGQLGKKNKTPIYAVYKRLTSNLGTHAD